MSHNCPTCKQALRPVHPIEVKRAIQLLVALSKDPGKMMGKHQSLSNLCTTGNSLVFGGVACLARTAAARSIEPNIDKWSSKWTSQEYNLAAQMLSDGWLPVGYILDKERDLLECCDHLVTTTDVEDPNGNWEGLHKRFRRVTTKVENPIHTGYYCALSKDAF